MHKEEHAQARSKHKARGGHTMRGAVDITLEIGECEDGLAVTVESKVHLRRVCVRER